MATSVSPLRLLARATLIATTLACSACPGFSRSPTESSHVLVDRDVTLAVGDETHLRSWLSVSLDRIVSDSRCPTGATCIWAGEVVVALTLRSDGRAYPFVLSDQAGKAVAGPYSVTLLTVTPHPKLDTPLPTSEYRVTIRVRSTDPR